MCGVACRCGDGDEGVEIGGVTGAVSCVLAGDGGDGGDEVAVAMYRSGVEGIGSAVENYMFVWCCGLKSWLVLWYW